MRIVSIVVLATCLSAACATSEQDLPRLSADQASATATSTPMINTAGAQIGTAEFTASPHGLLVRILISPGGLTSGWHGVHLHGVGDCSDTATFTTAGSHVHKSEVKHGLLYPYGPEEGDLPNISAAGDGSAAVELFTAYVTLSELQDADGSTLIIHAGPDDHMSQPIGGAGDRVACAAVPR